MKEEEFEDYARRVRASENRRVADPQDLNEAGEIRLEMESLLRENDWAFMTVNDSDFWKHPSLMKGISGPNVTSFQMAWYLNTSAVAQLTVDRQRRIDSTRWLRKEYKRNIHIEEDIRRKVNGVPLVAVIKFLGEMLEKMGTQAVFNINDDGDVSLDIDRPETDEEFAARLAAQSLQESIRESSDRRRFLSLKAQFEAPDIEAMSAVLIEDGWHEYLSLGRPSGEWIFGKEPASSRVPFAIAWERAVRGDYL